MALVLICFATHTLLTHMNQQQALVEAALRWVRRFFRERIDAEYVFHDLEHTLQVWAAVRKIGKAYGLSRADLEVLELAAIFHDTGFDRGAEHHEERSCSHAARWLRRRRYPEARLGQVLACILATRMPQQPQTFLERVLCDADMCHLGLDVYPERSDRVRQELLMTRGLLMDEREWLELELRLLRDHSYFTSVAELFFGPGKRYHMTRLEAQYQSQQSPVWETVEELARSRKKRKAASSPVALAHMAFVEVIQEEVEAEGPLGESRRPASLWRRLRFAGVAGMVAGPLLGIFFYHAGVGLMGATWVLLGVSAWTFLQSLFVQQKGFVGAACEVHKAWFVYWAGVCVSAMLAAMNLSSV